MSSIQIGRLALGPPFQWHEAIGDPVTNLGGAPIPAPRQALRHMITIGTLAPDGASDTLNDRLRIRRQMRSMLNNTPLKLQAYLYVIYSDDSDQNGWYVPDFGQLADLDGSSGLATGVWQLEQVAWIMAGHRRINREARNIWMKDLRTGVYWRDTLRMVSSTDFFLLSALQLSIIPHGATSISNAISGQVTPPILLPAGRDGGICRLIQNQVDLACISYERPDTAWGISDLIVYDRRGQITAPSGGPDTSWEEAYGPDHHWSWIAATPSAPDAPVLDNGLVRVRYDQSAGNPGFRVDVWNGTSYVEQGKMTALRSQASDDTWIASSLIEYTPDRAVVKVVLARAADIQSREMVFITMQRGEIGVEFECYSAQDSGGSSTDCGLEWTPALNAGVADLNQSAYKSDAPTGPAPTNSMFIRATAGTGAGTGHSGLFGVLNNFSALGASSFPGENWVAVLRCPTTFAGVGAYQHNLAVVQSANASVFQGTSTDAYGIQADSHLFLSKNLAGYLQLQLSFTPTQAQQIMEAENMTLGTNTTTASDALASGTGNNTTQSTRTTDANPHVSQATWPNSFVGAARVFARVKVSANTGSFYVFDSSTPTTLSPENSDGTGADDATVGTIAWTNPTRIQTGNPALTAQAAVTVGQVTHYIKATNFGFAIPAGSQIQSVNAIFSRFATSTNVNDSSVKLVKAGTVTGTDKSAGQNWPTSAQSTQYGGDLWGTTITPADVNNSGFGFAVSAVAAGTDTAQAYFAQMVIVYIPPNGTVTTTSTSYVWLDLGEITNSGGTLEIHAWMSAGAGTLSVDRIEAPLTQDRLRNGAIFSGARDLGQAILFDSRTLGALVAR